MNFPDNRSNASSAASSGVSAINLNPQITRLRRALTDLMDIYDPNDKTMVANAVEQMIKDLTRSLEDASHKTSMLILNSEKVRKYQAEINDRIITEPKISNMISRLQSDYVQWKAADKQNALSRAVDDAIDKQNIKLCDELIEKLIAKVVELRNVRGLQPKDKQQQIKNLIIEVDKLMAFKQTMEEVGTEGQMAAGIPKLISDTYNSWWSSFIRASSYGICSVGSLGLSAVSAVGSLGVSAVSAVGSTAARSTLPVRQAICQQLYAFGAASTQTTIETLAAALRRHGDHNNEVIDAIMAINPAAATLIANTTLLSGPDANIVQNLADLQDAFSQGGNSSIATGALMSRTSSIASSPGLDSQVPTPEDESAGILPPKPMPLANNYSMLPPADDEDADRRMNITATGADIDLLEAQSQRSVQSSMSSLNNYRSRMAMLLDQLNGQNMSASVAPAMMSSVEEESKEDYFPAVIAHFNFNASKDGLEIDNLEEIGVTFTGIEEQPIIGQKRGFNDEDEDEEHDDDDLYNEEEINAAAKKIRGNTPEEEEIGGGRRRKSRHHKKSKKTKRRQQKGGKHIKKNGRKTMRRHKRRTMKCRK
jgi:hypothetical protein